MAFVSQMAADGREAGSAWAWTLGTVVHLLVRQTIEGPVRFSWPQHAQILVRSGEKVMMECWSVWRRNVPAKDSDTAAGHAVEAEAVVGTGKKHAGGPKVAAAHTQPDAWGMPGIQRSGVHGQWEGTPEAGKASAFAEVEVV